MIIRPLSMVARWSARRLAALGASLALSAPLLALSAMVFLVVMPPLPARADIPPDGLFAAVCGQHQSDDGSSVPATPSSPCPLCQGALSWDLAVPQRPEQTVFGHPARTLPRQACHPPPLGIDSAFSSPLSHAPPAAP